MKKPSVTMFSNNLVNADRFAPKGKLRVVWEDIVDFCDAVIGDYNSFVIAKRTARKNRGLDPVHIFNDKGQRVFSC